MYLTFRLGVACAGVAEIFAGGRGDFIPIGDGDGMLAAMSGNLGVGALGGEGRRGSLSLALGRAAALPRPIGRSASGTEIDTEVENGERVEIHGDEQDVTENFSLKF
jgi:hypothetical protein